MHMDNFTLVRSEHLNHHGNLFGGALLRWVDEYAWIVASLDFPHCRLVTIGMDRVEFRHQVPNGSILRFSILPVRQGTTSITYQVDVSADAPGAAAERNVFSTNITFVSVDEHGMKCPLPKRSKLRSQGGARQ
jgi:acyl-CoA hydrolase